MKIYLFSGSGFAWRILLACTVKGISYEEVQLQPSPDDLKSDAFLKLSPRGKVPVLVDGDFSTPESMAAIAYLEKKAPEIPLLGTTPEQTGLIWRIILDFDLYVADALVMKIIIPIVTGQIDAMQASIQEAAQNAHSEIAKLETQLADKNWFVGSSVSAADIALYPIIEALIRFTTKPAVTELQLGFDTFATDYPSLHNWRSNIQALPNYQTTYPDFWRKIDNDIEAC